MLQRLDNLAGAIGASILSRVSSPQRKVATEAGNAVVSAPRPGSHAAKVEEVRRFNQLSRERAEMLGHTSWQEYEEPEHPAVKVAKAIGLLLGRILGILFGAILRLMRNGLFRR